MRILVTNDDGIDSLGLHVLARALTELGDVVIIAPDREFSGKVTFIAPIFGQPRMNSRRSQDVKVVEVFAELTDPGPLAVGMKVDVYFTGEGQRNALH